MKQEVTTKKVFIRTLGCQMNTRDSEVIVGLLRAVGYKIAMDPDEADIVILNTCSVRQHAEEKVWSEVGRIVKGRQNREKNRDSPQKSGTVPIVPIIGIVGCMAQNYKEQIFERCPQVDFVVGPSDIGKIPKIIDSFFPARGQSPSGTVPSLSSGTQSPKSGDSLFSYERKIWETDGSVRPEEIYHTGFYEDKEHAYVVISEGCLNYCTYCVVPYVRGELHNRKYEDILKEIKEAIDKGITRITLLGQNVNAYRDAGTVPNDFMKLLRMVNDMRGLKEFSFVTSHPRDTSTELFRAMAECDKLKKYLHLPAQSGSDRILKLMNRGYTRKFYLDLARDYRKIVKGGALTTDIIVGFPGETEEDFLKTFDLVREVEFNAGFIFKYSPRPNTEALKYCDDVPMPEKQRRHAMILELQKKISAGGKIW